MPYGEKSAYAAQAALKKKSPAYMKSSGFKMKSPLKNDEKPKLHTSKAHSTSVAPVIVPTSGELVDPHTHPKGYGYMKTSKSKKIKKKKNIVDMLKAGYKRIKGS